MHSEEYVYFFCAFPMPLQTFILPGSTPSLVQAAESHPTQLLLMQKLSQTLGHLCLVFLRWGSMLFTGCRFTLLHGDVFCFALILGPPWCCSLLGRAGAPSSQAQHGSVYFLRNQPWALGPSLTREKNSLLFCCPPLMTI